MDERGLFEVAITFTDLKAREEFLQKVCAGDPEKKKRLEALLAMHNRAGDFLESQAGGNHSHTTEYMSGEDEAGLEEVLKLLSPSEKKDSLGTLGHYEVLTVLGQGGFGTVLKAFDEKLHRLVAIKVLSPAMAATSPPRKRFLREARSAAAIKHENIVAVHSVEETPFPYIVMEFVDGITLQEKMDGAGPLDPMEIASLGKQIARGLAAAHAAGLIHRDIKPGNILIQQGPEHLVKITDFGLARAADDASITRSGAIIGTPLYMSPEQAKGGSMDHRSDLFSLGNVLYTMASGRPAFRAPGTVSVLKRVAEDKQRPLTEIVADTPPWLVAIIDTLLEKDPEARFQTAREVADLLDAYYREMKKGSKIMPVFRFDRKKKQAVLDSATPSIWPRAVAFGVGMISLLGCAEWLGWTRFLSGQPNTDAGSGFSSGMAATQEVPKALSADPDRELAGWAVQQPAMDIVVQFEDGSPAINLKSGGTVPEKPFHVASLVWTDAEKLTDSDLEGMGKCVRLVEIRLVSPGFRFPEVTDLGLALLCSFGKDSKIQNLDFSGGAFPKVTEKGIMCLNQIENLLGLGLKLAPGQGGAFEKLQLPYLASFSLGGEGIPGDWSRGGANRFPQVTQVWLGFPQKLQNLQDLVRLKRINNLSFWGCELDDQMFSEIANLPDLTGLMINGNKGITSESWAKLRELKKLKTLNLLSVSMDAKTAEALGFLPALETLYLSHSDLTDEGLAGLGRSETLKELHLYANSKITNKGLENLARGKKLEYIEVTQCPGITPIGILALEKALPKCKVFSESSAKP